MCRTSVVTAIRSIILLAALAWVTSVGAAPVGQVTNLSGPLFAVGSDGTRRVLSMGSQVEPGETLVTEDKTFAQVRFIDKGVVTLRPGTQFKIESFNFEEKAPEKDGAVFGLLKGALRSVTGLISKRGNQDAYRMTTPTATIGIRGTQFLVELRMKEAVALSGVDPFVSPPALPLLAVADLWQPGGLPATLVDFDNGWYSLMPVMEQSTGFPVADGLQLAQGSLPDIVTQVTVFEGRVGVSDPNLQNMVNLTTGMMTLVGQGLPPAPPQPVDLNAIRQQFNAPQSFQNTEQSSHQAPPGQLPPPSPSSSTAPGDSGGCIVR